ncbi:hypothetical protein [Pontibacter fetidus]|uniref:Uncharacterized protein n=1 Tax=Pontibacter fetidus TaxID=2700082 RepID=A0A6B2H2U1_9BACT|nr:hypothetical protein [Pontibacter fetidus]NDK54936.1 hypothetical protein [Pontibacter fetidus]
MEQGKYSFWVWLFYFILFEVVVYMGLSYLLSGLGESNQLQAENTVVPNWVKAVVFILLYLLSLLIAIMVVSNMVPNKHRGQLMRWVYMALLGLPVMLLLLFN